MPCWSQTKILLALSMVRLGSPSAATSWARVAGNGDSLPAKTIAVSLIVTTLAPAGGGAPPPGLPAGGGAVGVPQPSSTIAENAHKTRFRMASLPIAE